MWEVIPRELNFIAQLNLESTISPAWYILPNGRLDMEKLLAAFQQFYREHSEHWLAGMEYREAGPQLLMQAFLQRIVNGGGRVEREYGLGRRRTDLLVIWPYPGGVQRVVIELKVAPTAESGAGVGRRARADLDLPGHQRRGGGSPGHLRPRSEPVVAGEDFPARHELSGQVHHGVGYVAQSTAGGQSLIAAGLQRRRYLVLTSGNELR